MITIQQSRAARGMLGWTQQDLADACGLSKTAINNFEKGHSDIKAESLRSIRMSFESAEIEFMQDNGLRKRTDNIKILKGSTSIDDLFSDIHASISFSGGELLISHANNTLSSQISTQKLLDHLEFAKKSQITTRVLCAEGTKNILSPHDQCRWLSKEHMVGRLTGFVYGAKTALQLGDQSMVIVVNSMDAKNAETKRFEQLWSIADTPVSESQPLASEKLQA